MYSVFYVEMGFVITHIFHSSYVEMNQLFFVIIVNNQ